MPNDLRGQRGVQIICRLPPDISKFYAFIMYFASSRELQKVLYFGPKCELFSKNGELKSELFGSGQLAGLPVVREGRQVVGQR